MGLISTQKEILPFVNEQDLKLREYQHVAIQAVRKSFFKDGSGRTILCAPTGAGKTVIFCWLGKEVAKRGGTSMILVDRVELMEQATRTLRKFGLVVANITSKTKEYPDAHVYVGMVETVYRRLKRIGGYLNNFGNLKLIVCDEAHRGNYKKVLDYFNRFHVIGPTATPVAASNAYHLNEIWDDIVETVGIDHLVSMGFLTPDRTFSIDHKFKSLKVRAGEYTDESQMAEFVKPELHEGVMTTFVDKCRWAKTLCYNVNVQHSIMMTEQFRRFGFTAAHVDGTTPWKVREEIFKDFRENRVQILCNVGIATTGFDEESVACIIQNFCTMSVTKHLQTCGRGGRLCDYTVVWDGHHCSLTNSKKDCFYIIDMGQNYIRHGLWSQPRSWTDRFYNPKKQLTDDEDDYKECPNCETLVRKGIMMCPNCGYIWQGRPNSKDKKISKAELTEIKDYLKKTLPDSLKGKPFSMMTLEELCIYCVRMQYKEGWVFKMMKNRGDNVSYSTIVHMCKRIEEDEMSREEAVREARKAIAEKKQAEIEDAFDPKKRAAKRKKGLFSL